MKKKVIIRILLIILILGTLVTIFKFSSEDGKKSKSTSRKVTEIIMNNIEKYKNLEGKERQKEMQRIEKIVRKAAHFSIYTMVGFSVMAFLSTFDIKKRNRVLGTILVGVIYAASDEIHQSFTPGRSPLVTDVGIDTMGVILGIVLVSLIIWILKKCMKNIEIRQKM